jgi:hypothetical protein
MTTSAPTTATWCRFTRCYDDLAHGLDNSSGYSPRARHASRTGSYLGRRSGWSRGLRPSVSIDSARVTSCDIDHASARAIRSMVP